MTLTNKAFKKLLSEQMRAAPTIEPRCPHTADCGGCAFQERDYAAQVAAKQVILQQVWGDLVPQYVPAELVDTLEVVPSPDPFNYRTRMDYVATKGRFGLRKPGRFNYIVELETCHLIPPAAFAAAHQVWLRAQELGLPDYNIRAHTGFLRYIVVRRSPQDTLLLAAVTAAGDYDAAMEDLARVALEQPGVLGFHWLKNDTLTDLSFGTPLRHWGDELLPMRVGTQTLFIGPNTFFQNNVHLLEPLLSDVHAAVGTQQPGAEALMVADLYSGVGAITLSLAPFVRHVVSAESQAESAALARFNAEHNGINNVTCHAVEAATFLHSQPLDRFDVVVADPPRTGMGADVCHALLQIGPRKIVYVSCNPLTQAEDVQTLAAGYQLVSVRGYDMFPHTPHVESLAVLERRGLRRPVV